MCSSPSRPAVRTGAESPSNTAGGSASEPMPPGGARPTARGGAASCPTSSARPKPDRTVISCPPKGSGGSRASEAPVRYGVAAGGGDDVCLVQQREDSVDGRQC